MVERTSDAIVRALPDTLAPADGHHDGDHA